MPNPRKAQAGLLVVGLGTLVPPLDTAVNIAFPSITTAFALPLEDIRWIVIAYVLTYTSLMLACGRLGDLIGYRRIFQLGLIVIALGLACCAAAPSYGLLLLGRILQGVGAALTLSCGPALATSLFDESRRTRVLAFYAGVMAMGAALGPLIGGLLIARWGWAAVFAFRVPIALLALALSPLIAAHPVSRSGRNFDGWGTVLLVTWMTAALLALALAKGQFGPATPIALAASAAIALTFFIRHESNIAHPLIRLTPFARTDFALLNAASVVVNLTAFCILLLVPYYLVRVAGLQIIAGGIMLALGAGGTVIGSWLAGYLARRLAVARLAFGGAVLSMASLGCVSLWTGETSLAVLAVSLFAQGVGLGLFQVGYTDYITASLPLADRGVSGSLAMVTRTLGIVTGATGLAALYAHLEGAGLAVGLGAEAAFLSAFQSTFRIVTLALAGFLAFSLLWPQVWRAAPRTKPPGREDADDPI